ncbi:PKD domain-containing protein [Thioalkalivibrio sp. XN279]|uniref:PKD domain-containing protein n=1 Tax=Thioalkalivibrio sp. XN279 TaxID=2714953 RepID=UPI00140AC106|nr:PKD domain-containing protein [Thioalkalivibrio sp. XN279]NHA15874.1 PKD domain-containing protein [Thioalkalivibrio sp. XN279]
MKMHLPTQTDSAQAGSRESGFTLVEALISIAILGFGFATTMAIHGELLGSAGENRLRSTAMSLAEAKIEELRASQFDSITTDDDPLLELDGFGFFSLRPVSLKRCWIVTEVETDVMKHVQVAVSRASDDCSPYGADVLVTLSSRIARNDFGRAGTKAFADALYSPDGRGELVPRPPEDEVTFFKPALNLAPGGFDVINHPSGFALCDSSVCLVPDVEDGVQNFATINGNIFLSGRTCGDGATIQEQCDVDIFVEGNALCRLHYPGDAVPVIPAATDVESFAYISYSCVVANQWRRSITVLSNYETEEEKVCVGNPALVLADGDPNDQLRTPTRFYDGRQPPTTVEGDTVVRDLPHGVKGGPLEGELQANIGTVCTDGLDELGEPAACWADTDARGLVPGGHHFLLMRDDVGGATCSARMQELQVIDEEVGTYYTDLFGRNPDIFYCTSSKDYQGDFCTSYTRVSGFIANEASMAVSGADVDIYAIGGGLFQACRHFGAFGEAGGGYVCGVRNGALAPEVTGEALNPLLDFADPVAYSFTRALGEAGTDDYMPSVFPADIVARNFELIDAAVPPTALFTAVCPEGTLSCEFNASASTGGDGSITEYIWSFGDGSESVTGEAVVTYVYGAASTYSVTLTVRSDIGLADTLTQSVTVTGDEGSGNAPIPLFTVTCDELTCNFDAGDSFHPDASEGSTIELYAWDFGDGSDRVESADPTVSHPYAVPGEYIVELTVTDDKGVSAVLPKEVQPVITRTCNISVKGAKATNEKVDIFYDNNLTKCATTKETYTCELSNVLDGSDVEIIWTQGSNNPSQILTVNCDAPDTTGFNKQPEP